MEIFFGKQLEYWLSHYSSYPKTPYNESLDKRMLIENSFENGYIQWKPLRQDTSVDFSSIEDKLKVSFHPQIKEYFASYWFLSMIGRIDDKQLRFTIIPSGINIINLIEDRVKWVIQNFPNRSAQIELGFATVNGDDSYLIYVDNATANVSCVQMEDKHEVMLDTLEKVIAEMEVIR
jgi:hypothetical protein